MNKIDNSHILRKHITKSKNLTIQKYVYKSENTTTREQN